METASRIWITWERQRRNESMARWLSADLCELEHAGGRVARYLALCSRTIRLLRAAGAEIVFFQNPSLVLSVLIVVLKKLGVVRAKIVGDFHNAGVYPAHGGFLCRWIARSSDLTIVSNPNLVGVVNGWGAKAIAVPDPLPAFHADTDRGERIADNAFKFLFICSWADDEPVAEVVRAAAIIEKDYPFFKIIITGKPKLQKHLSGISVPDSIVLTGFLSEAGFEGQLNTADVILDLTTRPDCMVCGAYEAIAAEKPAILSDNPPTREYFNRGVEFTDNSAADIAHCMIKSYQNIAAMKADIKTVKRDIQEREAQCLEGLNNRLMRFD